MNAAGEAAGDPAATDANVVALLTPPGVAAVAVIRISGPLTRFFAAAHLARPPRAGRCVHTDFHDGDRIIDDVIAVEIAPDRLDLNLHGGLFIVETTLDLLRRSGFRIVEWSDAADTVFDTSDRIEKQMLLDLPLAPSPATLRLLTAQPAAWNELARQPDPVALHRALADTALERLLSRPTVAVIGAPNAGKSTLANALFGRVHAITADVAGTTRDWIGEPADLGGLVVRLVDTPGLRDAADPIEAAAIALAAPVVRAADLVVIAVDGTPAAAGTAARLRVDFPDAVIVRTKADRSNTDDDDFAAIAVSAHTGDGINALRARLCLRLGCLDIISPHARCWTPDQRAAVAAALDGGRPLAAFIASPGVYNRPRPQEGDRPVP